MVSNRPTPLPLADDVLGIPMTRKKFAELEVSLMHLQQNLEIPEVILSHNQEIVDIVEKVCIFYPFNTRL